MKTVGIIAEFNPFHNGHKYLIEQAKLLTGADCCVVIMSGDFVQRGAPAVCNKNLRTKMALKDGADIVFELPVIYSLGSAEMFAEGALKLLLSTGQIDWLCFGSECGDTEALVKCASIIEEYTATPEFKEELSAQIKSGLSYPSAFSKALSDALGNLQSLLYTPNNLLGIEYIRALLRLKKLNSTPEPDECKDPVNVINLLEIMAIKRIGADHFDPELKDLSSATAIRDFLCNPAGIPEIPDFSPLNNSLSNDVLKIVSDNYGKYLPITENDFSSMLYMRLNSCSDEELFSIPDINPDLIHKLIEFRGKKLIISDLIMDLKSKCFTYTAISRALFRILLCPAYTDAYRFLQQDYSSSVSASDSQKPYLRVLGFKKTCSEFLRNLRYSELIDIVTKPADGPLNNPCFKLDVYASNLYAQVYFGKFKTGFTEDLKTGPIIL